MTTNLSEMKRPATKQDVLDIAKGHLPTGGVFHLCGGRVIYSFLLDRFHCVHCLQSWAMKTVKASNGNQYDLQFWLPPMELDDGFDRLSA